MKDNTLENSLKRLQLKEWTKGEFSKQNWGVWMHSISSYVGRIKPSFAHFLIDIFSEENDLILDPFCGIGTIPLEADNMRRRTIANDLNPYANIITKAKFDRKGVDNELAYLRSIKLQDEDIDIESVPDWVKIFYHPKTLGEILKIRKKLIEDQRFFLLGCLLGIIHGHRTTHLSMRTGYIIPYIPKPLPVAEYREVIPRLIEKTKRMYTDSIPEKTRGEVLFGDAKNLSIKTNSVDLIISSPPYYHTLDYVHSNRLRLWFAGVSFEEQKTLSESLIQQRYSYLNSMKEVGVELKRVLKDGAFCIFILGDVHLSEKNTLNTAEDISEIYKEIGFTTHAIVSDEIPASKTTIVKYKGSEGIKAKKAKLDRILVMTKNGS
jgi:DNA modification methylase